MVYLLHFDTPYRHAAHYTGSTTDLAGRLRDHAEGHGARLTQVVAAAGIQTDKTADALKEFFNELNGILQPVPAEELTRAKHYVSLRYPLGFETSADIASRLEQALVYHLPDDYFSTYVQKIEAVTAAEVQRVAQKYILPGKFAVVIAGDRKTIEPGIRALNLGEIKIMTVDDVFGPAPTVK